MVRERGKNELTGDAFSIDALDAKILQLMVIGDSNQQISKKLGTPLSTVQRRTRELIQSGIIPINYKVDYKKFGYKTGLLHIYLTNGDSHSIAEKIQAIDGILDLSVHIGNSDLIAEYACKSTEALLTLLASIKKIPAVTKIVWSEEVFALPQSRKIIEIPAKQIRQA